MPAYLITKREDYYVLHKDRRPFNPEIKYSSLIQVLGTILTGGDNIDEVSYLLSREVAEEKDAQGFKFAFSFVKSLVGRLTETEHKLAALEKLKKELLAFDKEITLDAFLDYLKLENLL